MDPFLSGLEAPYFAMKKAWFFNQLEAKAKNSLQLYDAIKTECRNKGHTYVLNDGCKYWVKSYVSMKKK